MKTYKHLDDLFDKARTQDPVASYNEVSKRFTDSVLQNQLIDTGKSFIKLNGLTKSGLLLILITTSYFLFFSNTDLIQEHEITDNTVSTQQIIQKENNKLRLPLSSESNITQKIKSYTPIKISEKDQAFNDETVKHQPALAPLKSNLEQLSSNHSDRLINLPTDHLQINPAEETKDTVLFSVNESTPTRYLAKIASLATKAGIEYTYVVDQKRKMTREFNVEMKINGTQKVSYVNVSIPKREKFSISFGWVVNEKGKAISLFEDINIEREPPKFSLHETNEAKIRNAYLENGVAYLTQHIDDVAKRKMSKKEKESTLNRIGYLFIRENSIENAIQIFELNTQLFPDNPNTWDSLGEAYFRSGQKEKALNAFEKAIEIDPDFIISSNWIKKIKSEK